MKNHQERARTTVRLVRSISKEQNRSFYERPAQKNSQKKTALDTGYDLSSRDRGRNRSLLGSLEGIDFSEGGFKDNLYGQ